MAMRPIILGGVCAAALIQPAFSQEAPGGAPAQDSPTEQSAEIVVTGSRIARRDFTAESPIITVDDTFIQNSGPSTLDQSLNALPQFSASQGAQTSSIGTSGAGSSGGRSTANLRGLGPERTLVLFDGRRLQPSDPSGAIDLNAIPTALVSNVEVITGGASAVYGSDAIAGVINFRFNDRFTGLEVQGDAGISGLGDAATYSGSVTWGGRFADDRLGLFFSGSYLERDTASQHQRSFFDDENGTSSPTSGLIIQSGTNPFGFGAPASVAAYRQLFANGYGTAVPPVSSSYMLNADRSLVGRTGAINLRDDPATGYLVSDGVVRQRSLYDSTLQLPIERYTGFGRAEFAISDALTAYAQFNYATYTTNQLSGSGVLQSVVEPIQIRADNPFVTSDLRVLLNARPRPNAPITYYFTSTRLGRLEVEQQYEAFQGLGGFRGDLGGGLRYDVYVSHGETDQDATARNQVSRTRFNAVVNAADGGRSLCDGGYDPFGFAPASPGCQAYLTFSTTNRYHYEQTVVQGNVTGEIFDLPGGPVGFAVGAEYRRNAYSADIDPRNSPTATATPGVTTAPEALGTSGQLSTAGDIAVRELYGELLLPVFRNQPFLELLEFDLAYRYSDYDRIGGTHTYKAGGTWSPMRGISIRGGYSRAIRAPSLGNLYSPREGAIGIIGLASAGGGDPCDVHGAARNGGVAGVDPAQVRALCLAQGVPATLIDGYSYSGQANSAYRVGNPNLHEETADSYTIGTVVRPAFMRPLLRNFTVSVDYYKITVDDAIGYVTSPVALQQCFNFGGQNPGYDPDNLYCALIARDGSGLLASIDEPLFNLAKYETSGIDFQLDAAVNVQGLGIVSLNSAVSYVIAYKLQSIESEPTYDYAGTIGNAQIDGYSSTHPRWKHVSTLTLGGETGALSLRWRYIGEMRDSSTVSNSAAAAAGVPAVSYFDLIGRIHVGDQFEFRAGVTNLTDKQPPQFGGPATTATSTYDVIGRRFFTGFTARF
ncbi:TonB-dependent receptor plug domain-containing protein [Sphingosinithalassobacter portus]|uniref:TonB-dependent receptor plug domain-containing protein n=1 Tax=Stakelama portus TaxID=2676234 RepID=UPI000D6E1837|nr:TonB-dependent receptor [Sphingosinithalassobacter portus]